MRADTGTEPAPSSAEPAPSHLDTVVDALERLAGLLPEGHELFTAISDPRTQASDVLLRDSSGITSVRLGLADTDREQLTAMVTRLSPSPSLIPTGRPRFPAELLPSGSSPEPEPDSEPTERQAAEPEPMQAKLTQPETAEGDGHEREDDEPLTGADLDVDFRVIVEESPVPLMVIAGDGMIEYAAPAIVPTLGVETPTVLEGLYLAQLLHPDDRERVARAIDLSLRRPDAMTLTVRLRRWDGSLARSDVSVRGLRDNGRLILALAPAASARSGIDEVLGSERRQRALASAADAGTALIGAVGESAGTLVDLNPQFGLIVGAPPGALVGTTVWELVAAGDAVRVEEALGAVIDGRGARRLEVRLAGEARRHVSLMLGLDASSGDPPNLATVLLRDLTEQHRPLSELNRTVTRLERQNRELAEFARVTAHDLMAPLRALSGLMDVLGPQLEEQSEDSLFAVQAAIGRMLAMVDSAVGFADAQAREPEHVPVDLGAVVDRVLAMLGADIVGASADISVGELPVVSGDDIQLERLLASLIANALSYSGEDPPRIAIAAAPDGSMWQISVADEGIGVEPEGRESIFNLFERRVSPAERDSPSRAGSGYGIGLATARQIAEQHGGRIWVEPNRPRGSVFAFTVPGA